MELIINTKHSDSHSDSDSGVGAPKFDMRVVVWAMVVTDASLCGSLQGALVGPQKIEGKMEKKPKKIE